MHLTGRSSKTRAVDFRFSSEDEAFREEVRSWLSEHLVGEYAALGGGGGPADETGWDVRRKWEYELGRGGWIGIGWPKEYGGGGATGPHQPIFKEGEAQSNTPPRASIFSAGWPRPP